MFIDMLKDKAPIAFEAGTYSFADADYNDYLSKWQAVDQYNTSYTSADGVNWSVLASLSSNSYWRSTAYSSSLQKRAIVGIKGGGRSGIVSLLSSSISQQHNIGTHSLPIQVCNDVVWTGSRFVACGHDYTGSQYGRYYTSTDGSTWTVSSYAAQNSIVQSIAYSSSTNMVSVGSIGGKSTNDGLTWTNTSIGASEIMYGVCWSTQSSRYISVGLNGWSAYSTDGNTWTSYQDGTGIDWYDIVSVGKYVLAVGCGTKYKMSVDGGLSWRLYDLPYDVCAYKIKWSSALSQFLIMGYGSNYIKGRFI